MSAKPANQKAISENNSVLKLVKLDDVYPNIDQARKIFDENKLLELAASIKQQGLMNPVVVRPDDNGKFMIIAGERRYRACKILELEEISVLVKQISDESLACQMMIENLQRADITVLEEARGYQKMLDDFEINVNQLSHKLGISQPHRISDRLSLLKLKEEYQEYLEKALITPTQAFYISKVNKHNQTRFWNLIKTGKVETKQLAAVAEAFIEEENQSEMFDNIKLSENELKALRNLEGQIGNMFKTVSKFFNKDGELEILKKIDKSKAETVADQIKGICTALNMAEKKLREPLAKQKLLG